LFTDGRHILAHSSYDTQQVKTTEDFGCPIHTEKPFRVTRGPAHLPVLLYKGMEYSLAATHIDSLADILNDIWKERAD
jgi:predicted PolB exonuclease-like 3'-5' exonuclease